MIIEDALSVYYIKSGKYFNVKHTPDKLSEFNFPPKMALNNDITFYKCCLDGKIKEIIQA